MSDKSSDKDFGAVAINLGLLTEERLKECLEVQTQMKEMGIAESLRNVLVKKGYLTQPQITQILRTMGVEIQPIPGYKIVGRLGQGAMGTVYRAHQSTMDRTVAIKVLSNNATKGKNFIERFFREAQTAAKLSHRNVIQAYDAGSSNGLYYFVMEYVDGHTARHVLEQGRRMPEKEALQIALQIADALQYISENGMIHRDIKPENIMITRDGVAKLCDFGLAKSTEVESNITRSGFTFGTPYYMSPEQINGDRDIDIRGDLYSLGATLFQLTAGRPVFDGKDLREVLSRHLTEEPPMACDVVESVSERTSKVVRKLLQKERHHRYQTPKDVGDDIRMILRGMEPRHARRIPRRGSSGALIAAVASVLLVAGGVGIYSVSQQKPTEPPPRRVVHKPAPPPKKVEEPPPVVAPPPEAPRIDAHQEEAEIKFSEAGAAFEGGRWEDALETYKELDGSYMDVSYIANHRSLIWDRIAKCEFKLHDLAREAAEKEKAVELRAVYGESVSHMLAGRWQKALDGFRRIEGEDPSLKSAPADLWEKRRTCEREIEAGREWEAVAKLRGEESWAELGDALDTFETRYRGTESFTRHEPEIAPMREAMAKEESAAAVIEVAVKAHEEERWNDAIAKLDEIRGEFSDTSAYRNAQARLTKMDAEARAALSRPAEDLARAAWEAAEAAYAKGELDKALQKYAVLEGELAATEFAAGRKSEIEARKAEIGPKLTKAREGTAKSAWRTANKLLRDKKFRDALEIYRDLKKNYADTKIMRNYEGTLEKNMDRAQRELIMIAYEKVDDFERGGTENRWVRREPAGFERSERSHAGDHGLNIWFGWHDRNPDNGAWPRVLRRYRNPIPKETAAVSFWMRLSRKDGKAPIWFEVAVGKGEMVSVWAIQLHATPKWNQYKVALNQLRLVWVSPAMVEARRTPKMEPGEIRALGLSQVHPAGEMGYVIDDITLEFRR